MQKEIILQSSGGLEDYTNIKLVPNDVQAYKIALKTPYDLTGASFKVTAKRADGTKIEGVGTCEGNTAYYTLTNNMYSQGKEVHIRLTIISAIGSVLTEKELIFDIAEDWGETDISGDNRVPALDTLIIQVTDKINQADIVLSAITDTDGEIQQHMANDDIHVTPEQKAEWLTKQEAHQTFANALIGTASGETVTLTDVQPETDLRSVILKGETTEIGTGDKSPTNPYTLEGIEGIANISVSDGTNTDDYPITLPQPLHSLPDGTTDYIEIDHVKKTAKLVQNIECYTFTGNETFYFNAPVGDYFRSYVLTDSILKKMKTGTGQLGLCSHYNRVTSWSASEKGIRFGQLNSVIYFYTEFENVNDLKTFLVTQSVTVLYPLETPIITDLDYGGVMKAYSPTSTISTDKGSITVKYNRDINTALSESGLDPADFVPRVNTANRVYTTSATGQQETKPISEFATPTDIANAKKSLKYTIAAPNAIEPFRSRADLILNTTSPHTQLANAVTTLHNARGGNTDIAIAIEFVGGEITLPNNTNWTIPAGYDNIYIYGNGVRIQGSYESDSNGILDIMGKCYIHDITVYNGSYGYGISAINSTLSNCTGSSGYGYGISAINSTLSNCTGSGGYGGSGINANSSTLTNCSGRGGNYGPGINANGSCIIQGCDGTERGISVPSTGTYPQTLELLQELNKGSITIRG